MVKYVDNVDLIYAHDNRKLYDLTVTYFNQHGGTGERTYRSLREEQLPRYIGKGLAQRAVKEMSEKNDTQMAMVSYRGMDIEIGGAGMRNFYDKELVSIANKIGKKIGARQSRTFQHWKN